MSLQPHAIDPVPEETTRLARAAYPKGNVYMQLRDELGTIYQDQAFAHLFSQCGKPASAPWRLLLVCLLQFAEGLSDRQAADAVRGRLDWKYLLSLEMSDSGFDASALCDFRARLLKGEAEHLVLQPLLDMAMKRGWLKAHGKQRTDSTHVLAAIRALSRLETVGETMRATLNVLATVAPDWLHPQILPDWFDRYEKRCEAYRLPKGKAERKHYAEVIGADGRYLLSTIYGASAPQWLREIPMVQILRQVWVQQYSATEDEMMQWRDDGDLPPGAQLIHSPYDREARFSVKRDILWAGYKVHLTETCDDETPHLIMHIETTVATTYDGAVTETIQTALAAKGLLPEEHIVDSGYIDAELIVTSQERYGLTLLGPVPADTSWPAQAATGFDVTQFHVDWQQQQVTCPVGKTNRCWTGTHDRHGKDVVHIKFDPKDGRSCPSHPLCTQAKSGGRMLTLRPHSQQHLALQQARERQHTKDFKERYAKRAGIEGTIAQGVHSFDLRRSRYIGLTKTRLQHILIASALNVVRIGAWLMEQPRAQTRISRFGRLAYPHGMNDAA